MTFLAQWVTGHPTITALLVTAAPVVLFVLVALYIYKHPKAAVPEKTPIAEYASEDPSIAPQVVPWQEVSLEEREFNGLAHEFSQLKWVQQAALSQLWQLTSCPFSSLVSILENKGFGLRVGLDIVSPLKDSTFIEVTGNDLRMRPHPARRDVIKRLVEDWRRQCV